MTCTAVDPDEEVPDQLYTRAFYQTDGCQAFVARTDPDTLFDRCTKDVVSAGHFPYVFAHFGSSCLIAVQLLGYERLQRLGLRHRHRRLPHHLPHHVLQLL